MCPRASVLVVVGALFACDKPKTEATPPAKNEALASPVTASVDAGPAAAGPADAGSARSDCDDTSEPRTAKPIGHTSVVYRLELANGRKFAWKPNAKKVAGRYKGEIAAYRLARALALPNVVPACPRTFTKEQLGAALRDPAKSKVLDDETIADGNALHGVVIPWVEGLKFWPLEKEPLAAEVKGWLTAGSAIPENQREFARQASTLVAFDYLTGNWDRYSGENVGLDASGTRVLFIDNDAAFMAKPPPDTDKKNLARVRNVDRFSRAFVTQLRALTPAHLDELFREEEAGRELLASAVRAMVAARTMKLIEAIDEKIAAHGEAETLAFP